MPYESKVTTKQDGVVPVGSNLHGTCSTSASTTQKVVNMPDFNVLVSGVTIHVQFTYGNTASRPTLKVGSTAARPIVRNGSYKGLWYNGGIISFTYDGSNWVQNDADEAEDTTYGLTISGHTITLVEGEPNKTVTVPDNDTDTDTTYGITTSGSASTTSGSVSVGLVEGGSQMNKEFLRVYRDSMSVQLNSGYYGSLVFDFPDSYYNDGWRALGAVGYNVSNHSSSDQGASYANVWRVSKGTNYSIELEIRNCSPYNATYDVYVDILMVKIN